MPEDYSFLQEKIKDEAPGKKKIALSVARIICAGLLFGIAASISFFTLKPWAETTFSNNGKQVEIPKDEEIEEETVVEEEEEPVKAVLDLDSYQELEQVLGDIASEARTSMVTVSGMPGVIVANSGQEFLILVSDTIIKKNETFRITFFDNETYTGTLKQRAGNLNMAMLAVKKSKLKDSTLARIKVAELGNSNRVCQGETLIAVGSPFGYEDGIGYGIVSSVSHYVTLADGVYNMITTDMAGAENSEGALFNLDGEVVGIITPDKTSLVAYGISDIKTEIELMSNGKEVPYMGLRGTIVTKSISKEKKMPEGLYVTEIEKDSPAMKAGIQAGDIITSIGGEGITSLSGYHEALMKQEAGTEITLKGQRIGTETYVEIDFGVTVGTKK